MVMHIYDDTKPGEFIQFTGMHTCWLCVQHIEEGIVARPYGNPLGFPKVIVNGETEFLWVKSTLAAPPNPVTFDDILIEGYFHPTGEPTRVYQKTAKQVAAALSYYHHRWGLESHPKGKGKQGIEFAFDESVETLILLPIHEPQNIRDHIRVGGNSIEVGALLQFPPDPTIFEVTHIPRKGFYARTFGCEEVKLPREIPQSGNMKVLHLSHDELVDLRGSTEVFIGNTLFSLLKSGDRFQAPNDEGRVWRKVTESTARLICGPQPDPKTALKPTEPGVYHFANGLTDMLHLLPEPEPFRSWQHGWDF